MACVRPKLLIFIGHVFTPFCSILWDKWGLLCLFFCRCSPFQKDRLEICPFLVYNRFCSCESYWKRFDCIMVKAIFFDIDGTLVSFQTHTNFLPLSWRASTACGRRESGYSCPQAATKS